MVVIDHKKCDLANCYMLWCMEVCEEGALSISQWGHIVVNPVVCINCGDCVSVCVNNAILEEDSD